MSTPLDHSCWWCLPCVSVCDPWWWITELKLQTSINYYRLISVLEIITYMHHVSVRLFQAATMNYVNLSKAFVIGGKSKDFWIVCLVCSVSDTRLRYSAEILKRKKRFLLLNSLPHSSGQKCVRWRTSELLSGFTSLKEKKHECLMFFAASCCETKITLSSPVWLPSADMCGFVTSDGRTLWNLVTQRDFRL